MFLSLAFAVHPGTLSGRSAPSGELASMRAAGKDLFRLYIQGRKTPITMSVGADYGAPTVEAHRAPNGAVYGVVYHTESGAYTVLISIGFVKRGDRLLQFPDHGLKNARRNLILFVPTQPGFQIEPGSALLYDGKNVRDVGIAYDAFLRGDGSVAGWYYANKDGSAFKGPLNETPEPVGLQYFEWKNGTRRLKGRKG